MVLSSLAVRHVLREAHQKRDLQLGDSLFGLELVESESTNNLFIPGEDQEERYYEPSYQHSGKGTKGSKSTSSKGSKSCKCGKSKGKGSKSSKGGSVEYCPCDGSSSPDSNYSIPGPSPGDGDYSGPGPSDGSGHPDGGDNNGENPNGGNNPTGGPDGGNNGEYPGGSNPTGGPDGGNNGEYPGGSNPTGGPDGGNNGENPNGGNNSTGGPDGGGSGENTDVGSTPDIPEEGGGNGEGTVTTDNGVGDGTVTTDNGDGNNGNGGTGDGSDGNDSGTPTSGGAINCDAIREGTGPMWGPQENLNGELQAVYYPTAVEETEVMAFIYNVMNNTVRIWMAGCDLASRGVAEPELNATIFNVVMEQTMKSISRGECETDIADAECIVTDTPTNVYVGSGNTLYLASGLNDAIDRAVREGEFDGLSGLYSVSGPSGDTYQTSGGGGDRDTNSATAAEDDGLGVAAKVVIPVAAITLLLLAILFLQRRRQETTHVKDAVGDGLLDYDTDEETSANRARFVNDDDTLSSGPFDGMDDYNYNDSTLGQSHATMDVHVCQSSLCEACEHRDQHNGISFVKTGAPSSPERLPANSTREYSASDTVSL
eukprot:CAMPEP_0202507122 /NCGR_PEP_ID=MMETSP1361-20130828/51553_1 /ASSEMBLY_ACC=CAM_ASM_000849 /TAXON_ID=210615 /ORGANISM="Staurosira complex sp., Strain CCMP2646" /LENGTH=596 /DNA_ID=CAMNT_0049141225 /DNA_START=172 /DNA_END=1962 /DNA_ORIENTATION=-